MSYIKNDLVLIPTEEGYQSKIKVLDNVNTGFFFVGNIQTPKEYIGLNVRLIIEIVE